MRPPKRLLLFCADESTLASVAFALKIRMYAVCRVATLEAAQCEAAAGVFDCAVVMDDRAPDRSEGVVAVLRAALPDVPVMLVVRKGPLPPTVASLGLVSFDMAQMVEATRVLCVRRPGPKRKPVAAAADAPAVCGLETKDRAG